VPHRVQGGDIRAGWARAQGVGGGGWLWLTVAVAVTVAKRVAVAGWQWVGWMRGVLAVILSGRKACIVHSVAGWQ
jgi:hypothetical protein